MKNGRWRANVDANFTNHKKTHCDNWTFVKQCVCLRPRSDTLYKRLISGVYFQFHALKWGRAKFWFFAVRFWPRKSTRRGCLAFKSWAHTKSRIKCWSHVGSVESAAIISHRDSASPYGDHVSMNVTISPRDHYYCGAHLFLKKKVFKMEICTISNDTGY